jgi:ArsR family transcriptional regulator
MEGFAQITKALGEETRLRIMRLLVYAEPLCCCEITDILGGRVYNVSRHLKILQNAGCVSARKEGRWVYYSLNREGAFRQKLFEAIKEIPHERFPEDDENLRRRLTLRVNGKCVIGMDRRPKT